MVQLISLRPYEVGAPANFSPITNALDGLLKQYRDQQETAATGNALMSLYGGGGSPVTGAPGPGPSSMPMNALESPRAPNAAAAASWAANPAPETTLSASLLDSVRSSEGYMPKAQWDYKQWTNGYGTRAKSPGETIDRTEAERRLQSEIGNARSIVDKFAPNAPQGVKDALTSLTYNAGGDWMKSGLGAAVQRGDWADARNRFLQYNKAGGQTLPGLVTRRQKEAQWFDGRQQPVRVAENGSGISPDAMRKLATTKGTQDIAGKLILDQYERNNPTETQQIDLQTKRANYEASLAKQVGGLAQMVDQEQDPNIKRQMWSQLVRSDPRIVTALRKYGIDPSDPVTGPKYIIAEARGYQDQTQDQNSPQARARNAQAYGLDPNSDAGRSYILTGKLPREDQQMLTATDKKAILEADETVASTEAAISGLNRALQLSSKAYDGATANERGWLMSQFGSEAGMATRELNQVVTQTALQQLKAIFGGNPTEGERKILLDIQGSAELPQSARDNILREALKLAQMRLQFNQQRASELRSGNFYKPQQGGPGAALPAAPDPLGIR